MKFRFALDKLITHRQRLEDLARRDWLAVQSKVDAVKKKIDDMYQQIDDSRKRAGHLSSSGGPQAPALGQIDDFIRLQKIVIEKERLVLREMLVELERVHEIFLEAAKERKTIERLREKRYEAFKLAKKKQELKQVDDMVVTRFKPSEPTPVSPSASRSSGAKEPA